MSALVDALLQQIHAAGLVLPEREFRFDRETGRRWRFDLAYPQHHVAVEVDGGTWVGGRHTSGSGFAKDCDKLNAAVVQGWRVLRFTGAHIKDGSALTTLTRALATPERSSPCT